MRDSHSLPFSKGLSFNSPKFSPIVKINFQVGGLSDIIVTQRGVGASDVISFGALEVLRWSLGAATCRSIYCIDWHNGVAELQVLVERSKSWSWAYLFFFSKKNSKGGKMREQIIGTCKM